MTDAMPEQQAAITAIAQAPAPEVVKDVVTRLEALQVEMDRFNGRQDNPVASFNLLYTAITREVDQNLCPDRSSNGPRPSRPTGLRAAARPR